MVRRVEYMTNAVNILPTAAHRMPPASAPMSAARHCTRVLGIIMYMAVKNAVTIT